MEIQLCIVVCVLITTDLVAGDHETYRIPVVDLDTPDNFTCPSDNQLEAAKTNISNSFKDILIEIAGYYTCRGSGWRRVAFLDMTDPNQALLRHIV